MRNLAILLVLTVNFSRLTQQAEQPVTTLTPTTTTAVPISRISGKVVSELLNASVSAPPLLSPLLAFIPK